MRNQNPFAAADKVARAFHAEVKAFGWGSSVHTDEHNVMTFHVYMPRKCNTVFQSKDRAEAVEWARNNPRK